MERVRFRWRAPVANAETGESLNVEVRSYWSPDSEDTHDAISMCGQVQAWLASGKVDRFIPNGVPELLPAQ